MNKESAFEINDEFIARYLSGEAKPDEAAALFDWLVDADNKAHFDSLENAWLKAKASKKPVFNKQKAKVNLQFLQHTTAPHDPRKSITSRRNFLRIAASILVITTFSLLVTIKLNQREHDIAFISRDSVATITLPDHSNVILNRHSTLTYPKTFNKNLREVALTTGEAFFEITADKQKPFIVHTPAANVKVVGTKFNVAMKNDNTAISVEEGIVIVYNDYDTLTLTAGTTGIVKTSGKEINSRHTESNNDWGYASHKLTFKDTPLPQVIESIEKAYPCIIRISNSDIKTCRLTATFEGDPIEKIVALIAETLNLTVTKHEGVYILQGQGCS